MPPIDFILVSNPIVDSYADILHDVLAFDADTQEKVSKVTYEDDADMLLHKRGRAYITFHLKRTRLVCVSFGANHSRTDEIHWYDFNEATKEYKVGMITHHKHADVPSNYILHDGFHVSEADLHSCCSSPADFGNATRSLLA